MALLSLLPSSPEREPLSFERLAPHTQFRIINLSAAIRRLESSPEAARPAAVEHPAVATGFEPAATLVNQLADTPQAPQPVSHDASNTELMRDAYHKLEQIEGLN